MSNTKGRYVLAGAATIFLTLSFTAAFANPISVVASPFHINPDGSTNIIYCQGGFGCTYPIVVSSLKVTAADGTVYTYGAVPFSINSGQVSIPFGTGQSGWSITTAGSGCAGFVPVLGAGANTHCKGDYVFQTNGTENSSPFGVYSDFTVPQFGLGIAVTAALGLVALAVLKRGRNGAISVSRVA